jgi:aspartyl-tRNA(Asn)/glutamyl-tRNA(Gln) amidotransferase subunit C
MSISKEEIQHVARLARLALTEDEQRSMQEELGAILDHIGKLSELDTSDVEPTYHAVAVSNVLREDEVRPSYPLGEVLKNAPGRQDPYFLVPRILE